MGKKMDDADVKKECPSCGLGVALDARICEFCGWDFDEEDEWIIQIEKLERDLVLEKQKFEPGTVGSKIEASLHTPSAVWKASAAKAKLQQQMEEVLGAPESREKPAPQTVKPRSTVRVAKQKEMPEPMQAAAEPEAAPIEQKQAAQSGKVRRVRKVKEAPVTPDQTKSELGKKS